jgi:NAD(P)-dependent dehydrogenase (short-subunit alcohol dehydrogenase family)
MTDHPSDFAGRVVLMTGAGQGLGAEIARRFAAAGARVAVQVGKSNGTPAEFDRRPCTIPADLDEPHEVNHLVDQVVSELGKIDILVHLTPPYLSTNLIDLSPSDWDQSVSACLRGTFFCTQAAAKKMISLGTGGVVLIVAPEECSHPDFGHCHSVTAKTGIVTFTRSAAVELARYRIRVNALSPGAIERDGAAAQTGRMGSAQNVADACLFLASPSASWISGVNLDVDGSLSNRGAY